MIDSFYFSGDREENMKTVEKKKKNLDSLGQEINTHFCTTNKRMRVVVVERIRCGPPNSRQNLDVQSLDN